jgi:hypothetical protein
MKKEFWDFIKDSDFTTLALVFGLVHFLDLNPYWIDIAVTNIDLDYICVYYELEKIIIKCNCMLSESAPLICHLYYREQLLWLYSSIFSNNSEIDP